MVKRGRKPTSPNGEPKQRYTVALPTDVVAFLREQPNAAIVIESALRDRMPRAEEPRDFGIALPSEDDKVHDLRDATGRFTRNTIASATERLLDEWIMSNVHASHSTRIVRYVYEDHPGVTRYVCADDGEALTLTESIVFDGANITIVVTPLVSQMLHCSCGSAALHMREHIAACAHYKDCPGCGGTGWLRRY